jgi:hypothetical protein
MLNGYLNSGPATWGPPITYSYTTFNAIPYSSYNVYVYFGSDTAARPGTVTDGTTTYDFSTLGQAAISGANALFTQTTDTTGANPAADYAIFTGETASSLTITCTPTDLSPTDAEWLGISAIQIVAVPEPGTLAMAALGGIGMLVFGRRFKARR